MKFILTESIIRSVVLMRRHPSHASRESENRRSGIGETVGCVVWARVVSESEVEWNLEATPFGASMSSVSRETYTLTDPDGHDVAILLLYCYQCACTHCYCS